MKKDETARIDQTKKELLSALKIAYEVLMSAHKHGATPNKAGRRAMELIKKTVAKHDCA